MKTKAPARKEGTYMYFADQASVRCVFYSGKIYSLKGKTTSVKITVGRLCANLISFIITQSQLFL
jgi:hypothetical protein